MSRVLISFAFVVLFCVPLAGAERQARESATESQPAETDPSKSEVSEPTLTPENRSLEGLSVEISPGGGQKAELRERFTHALVLRIAADGTRRLECVDDHEHLRELLKSRKQVDVQSEDGE